MYVYNMDKTTTLELFKMYEYRTESIFFDKYGNCEFIFKDWINMRILVKDIANIENLDIISIEYPRVNFKIHVQ